MVDALIAAVEASSPRLAHRYYALKARWMGRDHLDYWDRNAPLPEDDDRRVGWDEAVSTVLAAYRAFSPTLAEIGRRFFDNDWIDAPVRHGKSPGAFAHPTVPGAHPYLLLNYQGKTRGRDGTGPTSSATGSTRCWPADRACSWRRPR